MALKKIKWDKKNLSLKMMWVNDLWSYVYWLSGKKII